MFKIIIGALAVLLLTGCSHKLEVLNINDYKNWQHNALDTKTKIGIVSSTQNKYGQQIIRGISSGLNNASAVVFYPYHENQVEDIAVDFIANIDVEQQYDGSGWNFLINFPGFLVWAPAWNGYEYKAKFTIDVALTDANNSAVDTFQTPVDLDIRHAEMDRTWTEVGWFEVGIIPLIGGIAFINYDDDVTPILIDEIEAPIGDYIAQEIVSRINVFLQNPMTPADIQ
ncbi:hypothetical protein WCX72_03535 [Sulfurimonas sp. HSL1-6]|uniref:hypothetical protein n=1 Tax=Thiomicrolovo immobilis TaxID=3131935 RepID=UPI0031F7301C